VLLVTKSTVRLRAVCGHLWLSNIVLAEGLCKQGRFHSHDWLQII
jgi:hypothetical protein